MPEQAVFGKVAVFSVHVSSRFGGGAAGEVGSFLDGVALGHRLQLDRDGVPRALTPPLTLGEHTARVQYSGLEGFGTVEGTFTVVQADTVTTIATPAPSVAGQPVALTATVQADGRGSGTPTGTVQFLYEGRGPIGEPVPVGPGGTAQVAAAPPAGTYRILAAYSGDQSFKPSAARADQQVNRAATAMRITSTPNPVASGSELRVTVSVTAVPPGNVPLSGTVRATLDGQEARGPVALGATGTVELRLRPSGTARTATLTVTYEGDANAGPSVASLQQTITDPGTAGASPPEDPDAAATVDAGLLRAMVAPLVVALRDRGLAALGRTVQRLRAPQRGRVEQRVFGRSARGTRVVLASARRRIAEGAAVRLRLRVFAAGRRLARRGRAVRLVIVTRFTPDASRPVAVTTRVTVGRRG